MTDAELATHYRSYLDCLNTRRLDGLDAFVQDELTYNGNPMTRADYRALLEDDIAAIPDLVFDVGLLVVGGEQVACRLEFHCTPEREWRGLRPSGRSIAFAEHVFYAFRDGRIAEVWSLLDQAAIEEQLAAPGSG
jgi:predicted ester cyclase